ncbi:cell division protein ZapD [Legionella yabuuchiae]|uniref:cell division protein ZapD n=1 Tax=Legionella yabuuchiae TaxID=376727 RepID=UPI001055B5E0|nr:cell division protein ZapD [Legionella yabuuchiae]
MLNETITFQLATHFLSKIALRLECLFLTVEQACEETHPVIHHYALKNIIEIVKIVEKPELKSRFLKELMRIEHAIHKTQFSISSEQYTKLFTQVQYLSHAAGRLGGSIQSDPFLQAIRLAQASEHNDCEFHSPQLLLWLENTPQKRQHDLLSWLKKLQSLQETVSVYLSLLRNTAQFNTIDMYNGFYQRSLPSKISCHLILLRMDKDCGIVPKMHVGHHGLSLRLCEANSMNEVSHSRTPVDLAICQI